MVGLGSHSCLQWRGLSLRRPSAAGSFGSRYADTAAHQSRPVLHRRGVSSHTESNPSVVLWHISTSTNFAALHRDQLCKESGARRQARTRTRRNATRTRRNAALHMAQRITSPMLRSSEGPLSAIFEPLAARPSHAIRFARMRPAGYEIAVVGAESHRRRRADHCVSRRAGTRKYSTLTPSAYSGPCAGRKQRKSRAPIVSAAWWSFLRSHCSIARSQVEQQRSTCSAVADELIKCRATADGAAAHAAHANPALSARAICRLLGTHMMVGV